MYEAYFQLQKRPFAATPDASCCFTPDSFHEVLSELIHRVENGQGIGILTAPAGIGKTLLCRRLIAELHHQYTAAFLVNANFPTRRALLQTILYEFGQRYSGLEEQELRLEVLSGLKNLARSGRPALLVIDEAHLMNDRLLEEVRAVSNLAEGGQPLARIVLSGQPALEERLTEPEMEALNQRVACHVYLEPMTRNESIEYIDFRLRWAGRDSRIFTADALQTVAHACNGLPRCLNQLCDHSLLLAYVAESPQVTRQIVEDALSDLKQLPLHWNVPLSSPIASSAIAVEESPEDHIMAIEEIESEIAAVPEHEPDGITFEIGGGAELPVIEVSTDEAAFAVETDLTDHTAGVDLSSAFPVEMYSAPASVEVESVEEPAAQVIAEHPLPDLSLFEEESVVDRYAALDAGLKHVPARDEHPISHEVGHSSVRHAHPERLIEEIIPLLQQACADELDEDPKLVSMPHASIVHTGEKLEEMAEELGSDVFDVCLDVQSALLDRLNTADIELPPHEGSYENERSYESESGWNHDVAGEIPPEGDVNEIGYDVIEPEPEVEQGHRAKANDAVRIADPPAESGSVPRPNYKRVFSTLRRKLGRAVTRDQ